MESAMERSIYAKELLYFIFICLQAYKSCRNNNSLGWKRIQSMPSWVAFRFFCSRRHSLTQCFVCIVHTVQMYRLLLYNKHYFYGFFKYLLFDLLLQWKHLNLHCIFFFRTYSCHSWDSLGVATKKVCKVWLKMVKWRSDVEIYFEIHGKIPLTKAIILLNTPYWQHTNENRERSPGDHLKRQMQILVHRKNSWKNYKRVCATVTYAYLK